ncbi:LuxR C-terminal-related transcriptional regulator [Actinomadura macrotermitis]|uniref:Putative transcriptional regulatory protein NarL n=1 Tax=Actinomadura macrotermitis TaxID=2585200 RepID=A0A7K0C0C8_9ACTN|nr:response regulator transcription factor [Actinomadura macrotermitis]MQY06918.1 putative transcriptional regulatory protein NarL [Actinomadura macrotermitis]
MRVIVCDDHAVFADSLSLVLADAGHVVVGVVYSPADALPVLRARQADVCLIDLHFPAGTALEWMPRLRAAAPATRFVVLTGFLEQPVLSAGLALGVRGFAHKGQQARDILGVLGRVAAGEVVVDQAVRHGGDGARPRSQAQRVARFLTPREREVLTRLARGESTQALAKSMGVTRSTARSHVQSVLSKLGVHSQREAVIEAARHGLVSVETGEWLAG